MSELFSLVKESSISSNIFSSTYSRERYVESSIRLLENMNQNIEEKTIALYNAIAEANDSREENAVIKNFIATIRQQLTDLSLELDYMESRFAIALANHCDSVKYLIDKNPSISTSAAYPDKYIQYNKKALLSSSTPRMNPHTIFEREFNFIAQLMQDLPITASNKDKLNVVATVCDKFNGTMKNDIRSKLYADIFGDENASDASFNSYISSLFHGETEDKNITADDFNDAVECINSYNEFIDCISEMNSKLVADLNHIVSDLNSILACGDRGKFKVDTKEDGIKNTIYSVDVYTSNKIMWLAQEKVNQIVNVYNKYILALSIKMESILSYVSQSSDIISSFVYLSKDSKSDTNEEPDTDVKYEPSSDSDDLDTDDGDLNVTDTNGKEVTEEEEPEDNDSYELDGDDENTEGSDTESVDLGVTDDPELEEACREFYISMHECSCMIHECNIIESALSLLSEDGEQPAQQQNAGSGGNNGGDNGSNASSSEKLQNVKQMVGKVADQKEKAYSQIIQKMIELWNKFKNNILENDTKKVEFLNKNVKFINMKPVDAEIEKMSEIHHEKIKDIDIPDLNYQSMKDHLGSEKDFIESQPIFKKFMTKEGSLRDNIINSVISPDKQVTNATQIDPSKIYNEYCKDFISITDEIKKMTDTIESARKKADLLAKNIRAEATKESTIEEMYFAEFTAGKEKDDVNKQLSTYFTTCGNVLAAKMTVCRKVFNEYNGYLVWHIRKMGGGNNSGESDKGSKDDNNNSSFQ